MPRVAPVPPSVGSFITGQSLPNYVGSFITGQSCGEAVDDDMENIIVSQLLYLDAIDPNKDIVMYVNSPGGSLTAGILEYVVITLVSGVCAASDIWSVGCTVIKLLTSVPPYYDLQPMPAQTQITIRNRRGYEE